MLSSRERDACQWLASLRAATDDGSVDLSDLVSMPKRSPINLGDGYRSLRNWVFALSISAHGQTFVPQQIKELSEEVSRVAAALAELSLSFAPDAVTLRDPQEAVPEISAQAVVWLIKARSQRARYLSTEFCDPAWDILLDLLRAELSDQRVPVSSACLAAGVPQTTALRYLNKMAADGTIIRRSDPLDGRRDFVELAPETSTALRRYIADVVQSSLSQT